MKQVVRQCYHDGLSRVTASGTVDDRVTIKAPGVDYASAGGAPHAFQVTGDEVPAGFYEVCITHSNIPFHPAGNVSVLTGSAGPFSFRTIIPTENEEVECDPCSCACNPQGDTDGGSQPGPTRSAGAVSVAPFGSSSGGGAVSRAANARHMRFAFSFGAFRGMGRIPGGQAEIVAFDYSDALLSPAALSFKHPLASALVPEGDAVEANKGFRIFDGAAYANYYVSGDGSYAFAVGASGKGSEVVRFVSAIAKDDSVVRRLGDGDAAYVRVAAEDGSALFFSLADNEAAAFISSDGAVVLAGERLSVIRDAESGAIRQIWSYWDGLADVVPAEDGFGYAVSLYLPGQIEVPAAEGGLFSFSGDPFKSFAVSGDAAAQSLVVRERDWSLPESMPDYVSTWTRTDSGWDLSAGEGEDAVAETRVKSAIEGSDHCQIVTTLAKGGVAASCVREEFISTPHGELCVSRTEGYGSDAAQTKAPRPTAAFTRRSTTASAACRSRRPLGRAAKRG